MLVLRQGLFGQWDHDYPDRPEQLFERSDLGAEVVSIPRDDSIRLDARPAGMVRVLSPEADPAWAMDECKTIMVSGEPNHATPADATEWVASLGGELSNVGGSLTFSLMLLQDLYGRQNHSQKHYVLSDTSTSRRCYNCNCGWSNLRTPRGLFEGSCIHVGHQ